MKLNNIELKNIENEIEKFENEIDFEFVPVVADQSASTEHVPWMITLIMMILFLSFENLILKVFFSISWYDQSAYLICAWALAIILSSFLSRFDFVQRLFISKFQKQRQTKMKAEHIFYKKRLDEVKSQNALLIYISVMERQIVILPDSRIKLENINQISNDSVKILQTAFKNKKYESGLIEVIHYLKKQFETDFVRSKFEGQKQENLVSNKLIWWKD